jgi:hypothetical protein
MRSDANSSSEDCRANADVKVEVRLQVTLKHRTSRNRFEPSPGASAENHTAATTSGELNYLRGTPATHFVCRRSGIVRIHFEPSVELGLEIEDTQIYRAQALAIR